VSANYWPHGLLSSLTLANTTLPTIYYGGSTGSGLDGEGRVTTVTASSGTPTLASSVIYTTSGTTQPIGSLTSVTLGSGDSDTFGYDPLTGRLTGYTFNMNSAVAKTGGLTWNANGSLGQLALIDNVTPSSSQTCSYSHDDLARIASASCVHGSTTLWGQTFAFDPFGNIDKTATAGTNFLPTYNLATNQYSSLPGCTPSYDGDGNLTNDCMHSYNWLADGAVASVDAVSLTYDALGRAVEQGRGSSYTQIVYAPGGGKLALMSGATMQKGFIPLPGGGTAVYTTATGSSVAYYRHADWLGSSRLATTPTAPTTVYADAEYGPYGEPYGTSGTPDFNFTGQNQDTVSSQNGGLYDFLFREYNPQHSRWISPDPAGMGAVSLGSPQTWNRYAYVGNGPLNTVDPLGLVDDCTTGCNHDPIGPIIDASIQNLTLDFGTAWLSFQIQQFKVENGLLSPMQEEASRHESIITTGWDPVLGINRSSVGIDWRTTASNVEEEQKRAVTQALLPLACAGNMTAECAQEVYDSLTLNASVGTNGLKGGNYNFNLSGLSAYGLSIDLTGCSANRCDVFNSLHFNSAINPTSVHLDTANPYIFPVGSLAHLFVDVILGNTVWASGIPR